MSRKQLVSNEYLKILRLNHWFKNLVVLLGVVAAVIYYQINLSLWLLARAGLAFILACLVSSANYIINDLVDEQNDSWHPIKKNRALPKMRIGKQQLYLWLFFLLLTSFLIASISGWGLFFSLLCLFIAGAFYNLRPLRLKDMAYMDVISESVNNPIRFLIGWLAISGFLIWPPLSLLLIFWASASALMSAKRYSELNFFLDFRQKASAPLYRVSYRVYTLPKLYWLILFYLVLSLGFLIFFSFKYKPKLLISLPLMVAYFIWFLKIVREKDSFFREPETGLVQRPLFVLGGILLILSLMFLVFLG